MTAIRVLVWNEFRHERKGSEHYPEGMHSAIAQHLDAEEDLSVATAILDQPEHGLTQAVLDQTDVLIWWGHAAHREVADAVVDRVVARVHAGMGFVALHSSHNSKVFRRLLGTTCSLKWREEGEKERVWVIEPGHPIATGLPEFFDLERTEMYGERFDIPAPDELVMLSWFAGGEVFRSGCCYRRGAGKVFYFRPGHETYPIFHHPQVIQVLKNAARWAAPTAGPVPTFGHYRPLA